MESYHNLSADTITILDAALAFIHAGISIIPIDHTTKRPLMRLLPEGPDGKATWNPFRERIATEDEVRRWAASGMQAFAVVCGKVSGGLVILDFDIGGFYDDWAAKVDNLADGLPVQKTGNGYHVLFRCPDPSGNLKLAWERDEDEPSGRIIAIETRGEGGYAVVAPSRHPNGTRYAVLPGRILSEVPIVTSKRAGALLEIARQLDQAPLCRQEEEGRGAEARVAYQQRFSSYNGQTSVIKAFNATHSIETVLEKYGYRRGRTTNRYIRPDGHSESVSVMEGQSYHWSTNDPLNDGRSASGGSCHDAFDVYAYYEHRGDVRKAVKAAVQLVGQGKGASTVKPVEAWPAPQPLPDGLPPVAPFDDALLPTPFRPWVKDVVERMQCPADYCAVAAMVAAASLIGRKVCIRPKRNDDWQVVPNLFGLAVGRPSVMKSPSIKEMLAYLMHLEAEAAREHKQQKQMHDADALVTGIQRKLKVRALEQAIKKEDKDIKCLVNDLAISEDPLPVRRRYIITDATVEKLGVILNENSNGVLLYRDELIGWLRSMERDGHEADRAFYLTAWDGDSRYTYDRIGRGTLDIEAAILSIIGAIQTGVLQDYLRQAIRGGAGDDGLMQRFQLAVWPDMPASWKNIDRQPDSVARNLARQAFEYLSHVTPAEVGAELNLVDAHKPPFLRLNDEGQHLFDAWREKWENLLRSGTEHPALEAHLAKYRKLVPALALILHLTEQRLGAIGADCVERAIAWADYLVTHARRLYASVTEAPAVAARELARRIAQDGFPAGFSARDVYRMGWAGLDREATGMAIDVLLSLHWIEERIEETGGRPKTLYVVNPRIHKS